MSTQSTYVQKMQQLSVDYIPKQPENIPGLSVCAAPSSQSAGTGVIASDSRQLNLTPGL